MMHKLKIFLGCRAKNGDTIHGKIMDSRYKRFFGSMVISFGMFALCGCEGPYGEARDLHFTTTKASLLARHIPDTDQVGSSQDRMATVPYPFTSVWIAVHTILRNEEFPLQVDNENAGMIITDPVVKNVAIFPFRVQYLICLKEESRGSTIIAYRHIVFISRQSETHINLGGPWKTTYHWQRVIDQSTVQFAQSLFEGDLARELTKIPPDSSSDSTRLPD
jgi:hypothetical protein